jgi:hypothetical protein
MLRFICNIVKPAMQEPVLHSIGQQAGVVFRAVDDSDPATRITVSRRTNG